MKKFFIILSVITTYCFVSVWCQAKPKEQAEAEALVEKSTTVVSSFTADPDLDWFRKNVYRAQAVLIIPQNLKGAFLVGGAGGSGVLLARDIKTGQWSYPAFYTLGSLSIGLQAGAESSEIILMVMTERGMESMLTSSFKLGADVTLAAGPVGVGAKAKTADIISYARAKGVFAGVSLDGAVVKTRDGLNGAYYGRKVSPTDILIRRDAVNGHADKLRAAVKAVAK